MLLSPSSARALTDAPAQTINLISPVLLHAALIILGLLTMLLPSPAWADLVLHPTRVVFEGDQRAAQLQLINNGKETATYRLSLVNRRMNETGQFAPIDSPLPGEQFSEDFLRFSPRQVVLAPGASQTVRILLRKPAGLAAGEYRSHLQFDRIPEVGAESSIDSQASTENNNQVGVQLKALIGVSVPVIVRHGDTSATVSMSGMDLQPGAPDKPASLGFTIQRAGNQSVYGDLAVTFTPQGGTEQEIAKAGGIAVYTPNPVRRVKLELQSPANMRLERGKLRVTYHERADAGGKVLAEAVLDLP